MSTIKLVVTALAVFGASVFQPLLTSAANANSFILTAVAAPGPPPLEGREVSRGWQGAAHATLDWDFNSKVPARQRTDVYLLVDRHALYVRFEAQQSGEIQATQHNNNVGQGSDDEVHVELWPGGSNGFYYEFIATPIGTRYQTSSENSSYAPEWRSAGTVHDGGYTVTMAIPLEALRGDGRASWKLQLWRVVRRTNETYVWSHADGQYSLAQVVYAGTLESIGAFSRAARTKPRIGVYTLAEDAAPSAGGPTSRLGADLSIPVTATASFVATLHPDYSNVELDQQTIAPTAFRRTITEVRPFFSQGVNFYNTLDCFGCPEILELYTPSIPTPHDGYALEGAQGPVRFGAFDAVGGARNDTAQGLTYTSPSRHVFVEFARTSTNVSPQPSATPLHDVTNAFGIEYTDQRHLVGYFNYGYDRGAQVLDRSQAQRYDSAIAYQSKDDFDSIALRKVGTYYAPADGFVSLTDLSGYSAQLNKTFELGPTRPLTQISAGLFVDHYSGHPTTYTLGDAAPQPISGTNLADFQVYANFFARNKFSLFLTSGSSYSRLPNDILRPFNQNGVRLDYLHNTALTDSLSYNRGRFDDGFLNSWTREAALRVRQRTTLSLELDDTDWYGDSVRLKQWLERASVTFAIGRDSSFVFGARRIVGSPPPIGVPPADPASTFVAQTNLSFAFSQRRRHDELYLVYGDASQLTTRPALTLKYIYYFGAQKGT